MLLVERRRPRLNWIIRQDGEEFPLSACGEAELSFLCITSRGRHSATKRKSTSSQRANRAGIIRLYYIGISYVRRIGFPWTVKLKTEQIPIHPLSHWE